MKRYSPILLCAAIILLMVGCVKSDIDYDTAAVEQEIRFTSTVEATKATETDTEALEEYGKFNVATFLTDTDNSHYYTDVVNYDSGLASWSSDVVRYWPVSYNLNMFAYSPLAEDYASLIAIKNATDYSNYSLTYTCPADIDEQIDLLVKTLSGQSGSIDGAVDLEFDHALSTIKFNVEIEAEKNVTLDYISLNYMNIEKQCTYNFSGQKWDEPEKAVYFDMNDGLTNTINVGVDKILDVDGSSVSFSATDINNQLMIIPQPISGSDSDPHYISVQVVYTLNSGVEDESGTLVTTGVMPLPAPDSDNEYKQGYAYTYNIKVNGETMTFGTVSIDDQEDPVAAYGNIDLGLISTTQTYDQYETNIESYIEVHNLKIEVTERDYTEEDSHYYYSSAERVFELLADGVRDFVVVGSFGDDSGNSDGKLGYYGSFSSPFYIAANSLGIMPSYEIVEETDELTEETTENMEFNTGEILTENLFSIDLRGVYNFPTFGSTHTVDDTTLDTDAPILTKGIFKDLPLLDEVIFPSGLLAIGDYAFQNCISLSSVDLAEVIHIEAGAFVDCVGLTEVINGAITRVHENGFDDCINLQSIDLSNLEEVNQSGFVDCKSLGAVNLSSLVSADAYAFGGCVSMSLLNSDMTQLTTVGTCAFQDCANLAEVKFGSETLTSIADHAFSGCTGLYFADSPMILSAVNEIGTYAFQNCSTIGAIQFPLVTTVADGAFDGCTNVEITGDLTKLTSVGAYAFQNCTHIGILDFDALESVGVQGFYNCTSLMLADNDDLSKLSTIEAHAFQGCSSIDNDDLNLDNVGVVGDYAFQGCSSLEGVSLDGATAIGELAFENCSALKSVDFGLIETIGASAFSWCENLSGSLVLDNLTTINDNVFYGCSNLEGLTLNNVTTAGDNFISGCTSLKMFVMPNVTQDSFYGEYDEYAVTTISGMIQQLSSSLVEVDVESLQVGSISMNIWADGGNTTLESLNIASCSAISTQAFYKFYALKSVIASSAKSVGYQAFYDCTSLESIDLSSAESVESYAFQGCTSLTALELPLLTVAGDNFFDGCSSLVTLSLPKLVFDVPGWGGIFQNHKNIVTAELSLAASVGNGAFSGATELKIVDLRSATTVGAQAFDSCTSLEKINLSSMISVTDSDGKVIGITTGDDVYYDDGNSVYSEYYYTKSLFWGINTGSCELWLSDELAALAVDNVWMGFTWSAIHRASDGEVFTLE